MRQWKNYVEVGVSVHNVNQTDQPDQAKPNQIVYF